MSSSSSSSSPASLANVAAIYRIFTLDDVLADPRELIYDSRYQTIYMTQRCRVGTTQAPVEWSQELSVIDATSGNVTGNIDISPFAGPHALELDTAYNCLYADVESNGQGSKGRIGIDLTTWTVAGFDAAPRGLATNPGTGTRAARQIAGRLTDFVAEIDLATGVLTKRINVPASERRSSARHITFTAPALQFAQSTGHRGSVLDPTDEVVRVLRNGWGLTTLYVTSRSVLIT